MTTIHKQTKVEPQITKKPWGIVLTLVRKTPLKGDETFDEVVYRFNQIFDNDTQVKVFMSSSTYKAQINQYK